MLNLPPERYREIVRRAIDEDVGSGDVTTEATVVPAQWARGTLLAKSDAVLAGLDVALEAFRQLEPDIRAQFRKQDGDRVSAGEIIGVVEGRARALLAAERTALNFLQRLSGIATETRRFVDAAGGRIRVLDTRKTTPGLRVLEKYAVAAGGGANHRIGLYDAILIKDNHVRLAGGVALAVARARAHRPDLPLEVEVQTMAELDDAIDARADILLVDNMTTEQIREAVQRVRGRAKVEISGGVTLERVGELAETGADYVSVGGLTHSARAADISFEIEPSTRD
jgi:nicotinate-nucleotide pyrophosphorylase (carboxylating)